MRRLLYFLLLFPFFLSAQQFTDVDFYQFPINPGVRNYLAGTVGEIRSTHFHTGIDIKTGGKTGLPVYATADGFISRIRISLGGYGHTLYMQHPNGMFSVYAHLDRFQHSLQAYIREKQYEKESYIIELFPEKDQFKFKRGEVIAFSGNTGSSSGPHLHFEIRDAYQRPLDVLKFGFSEIRDRIAPVVKKIAFITLEEDARVNDFFGRYEFDLVKVNNAYRTRIPIQLKGKVGVEIYSYDSMDGVPNKNGIVKTIMLVDKDTAFYEFKKSISFAKQRSTLQHYNYQANKRGSRRFNKLYLDDGNEHGIYSKINRGVDFQNQRKLTILTSDSYENLSVTEVEINNHKIMNQDAPSLKSFEVTGDFLHFKSDSGAGIRREQWIPIRPYHSDGTYYYFIWDLRKGLPDSIFSCGTTTFTHFVQSIPVNQETSYYQQEFNMNFRYRSLFDTLHLGFQKKRDSLTSEEWFEFKNPTNPIRSTIGIVLNPENEYNKEKSHVYEVCEKQRNFIGGNWRNETISFGTRDLVTYTILTDTLPPKITPRETSASLFRFKINDERSGIQSYRAELNGKFVLMRYERKKKLIWSEKLYPNIPFKGQFKLEVVDNANNKTTYTYSL